MAGLVVGLSGLVAVVGLVAGVVVAKTGFGERGRHFRAGLEGN